MSVVVPLFLLGPLLLVPLGYRLLEVASPRSRPPAVALRLVPLAAGSLVVAFWLPAGPIAAAFAGPWLAVTGVVALVAGVRWMGDPDRFRPGARHATDAAVGFLAVGATFALTDRLGTRPFGFSATIILLTAVHFLFAGFVLPLAGALAYARRPRRWLELGLGAVVVGIPITALGFFGLPLANWIGAVLTATGGLTIGIATLAVARGLDGRAAIALAVIAGASLLVSMPMAVVYATGTLVGDGWLGLDVMARIHGGLNILGFALPAMLAWTLGRRPSGGPAGPLEVMRFNARPFALGSMVALLAGAAALTATDLPTILRLVFGATAIVTAILTVSAVTAVVWVFEIGASRRWQWVRDAAASPRSWVNVTTGFDDSTATLRQLLPASDGVAFDVFDPTIDHESALLTARARYQPVGRHGSTSELARAMGVGTQDAIFLLMSAHEASGDDRGELFATIHAALSPTGRLILVEHLRDVPNRLAFGPGADHFQTGDTWLSAASAVGLAPVSESRLTPFVHGFLFQRAAS